MTGIAIILYEDERGPTKEFGLHNLVMACVADELDLDLYRVKEHADPRPMKGVNKLLQACWRDVRKMAARGQRVIALIDDDRIRDNLPGMDARRTDEEVIREIRKRSDAPEQLDVILLHKNVESVIEAARDCDRTISSDTVARALDKNLIQRDRIFHNVARSTRDVRNCIRSKIPAIERLVQRLVSLVRQRST